MALTHLATALAVIAESVREPMHTASPVRARRAYRRLTVGAPPAGLVSDVRTKDLVIPAVGEGACERRDIPARLYHPNTEGPWAAHRLLPWRRLGDRRPGHPRQPDAHAVPRRRRGDRRSGLPTGARTPVSCRFRRCCGGGAVVLGESPCARRWLTGSRSTATALAQISQQRSRGNTATARS